MGDDGDLRGIFRTHLPMWHWQSVETGGTGQGVPDSNYCYEGAEGWIEYKWSEAIKVRFRPEQPSWLSRRARAGGRVFVAVRKLHDGGPRRGPPVDELWILAGGAAAMIVDRGLDPTAPYICGLWRGGPAGWGWSGIARVLTR